jgi:hypothetical protein
MKITRGSRAAFLAFGLLVGFLSLDVITSLQAQQNFTVGAWRLNVAKSKYVPGPAPISETRLYEPYGAGGVKATFNRVEVGGSKLTIGYSALYDGKDYPYTGSPDADTIAMKLIDANTTEATLKMKGRVTLTTKAVISADGKTRTLTTTGTNAKGQKVNNIAVFERQ